VVELDSMVEFAVLYQHGMAGVVHDRRIGINLTDNLRRFALVTGFLAQLSQAAL
jgi:hypothetical protein